MTVYILFHETNSGHSDESDGYIEAVYADMETAKAAQLALVRAAIAAGEDVYYNPDTQEEFPESWDHDWRVERHELLTEPAADRIAEGYGWKAKAAHGS